MIWPAAEAVKQQIPLLDYLEAQDWKPVRHVCRGRLIGLCPLHRDHKPSFLVDPAKNLFYCYGCGRGGDLIRFVELYHRVRFVEAIRLLRGPCKRASLLKDVAGYYRMQLNRHPEAASYLQQRGIRDPEVIDELEIGYAPGRCLRQWLMTLGYSISHLQQAGLVNETGYDTFSHRVVFPLEANLYGRSIGTAAPHRFLPGSKGGLYRWDRVQHYPEIILVEGLFDLAALWQAGFRNVTCALGNQVNALQMQQLCTTSGSTVFLSFDSDDNGSGQQAAQRLAGLLSQRRVKALTIELPNGHDPNSFFASGGDTRQFRQLIEKAAA